MDLDQLENVLIKTIAEAKKAWPTVDIPPIWFVPYLAERILPSDDLVQTIQKAETCDLYLACAVAHLDPSGIDEFDRSFGQNIDQCLARCDLSGDEMRTRNEIFDSLFRSDGIRPGEIAQFRGCNPLISWLRATTTKMAVNKNGSKTRMTHRADTESRGLLNEMSEPHVIKHRLKQQYHRAFGDAMRSLTPRDRNLLRKRIADGLSLEEIGKLYSVDRFTASRWLVELRDRLSQKTFDIMRQSSHKMPDMHRSIWKIIHSHLDFSISRYLTHTPQKASLFSDPDQP